MEEINIFTLMGTILVDNSEAEKSLSKTDKSTKTLGQRLGGGIKTAAKWGAALVAATTAVAVGAFAMTKKVTAGFDDIAKNSRKMGISTDYYQEMEYWASQNGLSHENMEKSMKRLNQRLGQAVDGNKKYSDALTRLGVDMVAVEKGTVSTEEAMTQSIKALSEMENSQEKAALASELFGTKLSQELMPALDSGALSIEDAQKKAEELGLVIGEDSLNAAEAFNDAWDDITRSLTAAGQKVLAEFMPIFKSMMDWILENMPTIQAVMRAVFDAIGIIFDVFVGTIQTVIGWFQSLFSSNQVTMSGIWETIQTYIGFVIEYWKTIWEWVVTFFQENGQALLENAKLIFESIWETVQTIFNAIKEIIEQIIGYIVPFIGEQLNRIKQFWEENGKQIMQAVQNAFAFIRGVIDFIMPVITGIIKGAWAIISSVFNAAVGIIMGIVKTLASLLTGDFEGIKAGLTKVWESLWNGIKGIVSGAWTLLSGAFSGLWTSIQKWFGGLAGDAISWGKDLIKGFWEGIKGMGSWISEKVGGFIKDKVPGPIKKVLGIASPSRLMMEYGEDTVEGLAIGAESKGNRLQSVSENMANAMIPDASLNNSITNQQSSNNGFVESLLTELIEAVREGQNISLFPDGGTFARKTGDYTDAEGGTRVRRLERGLAT